MAADEKKTTVERMRRELMEWLNDDPLLTCAVLEADEDRVHEFYTTMIDLRKVGATRR